MTKNHDIGARVIGITALIVVSIGAVFSFLDWRNSRYPTTELVERIVYKTKCACSPNCKCCKCPDRVIVERRKVK